MSEWSQGLTLTQDVDWGFLLSTTLPASGVITQLHYMEMSSQGVMSGKRPVTALDCDLLNDSN